MIKILTDKFGSAFLVAIALIFAGIVFLNAYNTHMIIKVILLLVEGVVLNYLCFRYSILGHQSNAVLPVFATLSVLILPNLSYADLIYGLVWLGTFFLAFESRDYKNLSINFMIFSGILLGVAQTVNNNSILLMVPIFVLFIQAGIRELRGFILSMLYFAMVVASYVGILFVMERTETITNLLPYLTFDYLAFDTIITKLFFPFVILMIIGHTLHLNNYRFRFPNKLKITNYTMLVQLGLALLLILITAQVDLFIYAIMASAILLSFLFSYLKHSVFVNAVFASLVCIALISLYFYKILIL